MSIDTDQNILPGNIVGTLNQESCSVSVGKERGKFNKSFSEVHGNFMSNAQALSATRFVKVFDTQGKGIGQIFKNIGHNIKALFAGNGSAERTALEADVHNLEQFAKTTNGLLTEEDKKNLKNLFNQVRNAKAEHLEKIKADNGLGSYEKNILHLAKQANSDCESMIKEHYETLKSDVVKFINASYNTENTGWEQEFLRDLRDLKNEGIAEKYDEMKLFEGNKPFETLAHKALLIAPGNKEAVKTLKATYDRLLRLTEESFGNKSSLDDIFISYLDQKEEAKPMTLADHLETALRTIAKNTNVSLD